MRIGIDASCWSNTRGYGRFTRELSTALFREAVDDRFVLFADRETAAELPRADNVEISVVRQRRPPSEAASADGNRSPTDMLRFTAAVWRDRLDALFFPSVYTFFPVPPGQRTVVTIHDAIAERFPELTLPTARARWFWHLKVRLAIRQSDLILTVSEYAARDLERVLDIPPSRIRISGEAPSPTYVPSASPADIAHAADAIGIPGGHPWFTYVGGFNPHKNVDVIIRAHARVASTTTGPVPHLVLVGPTDEDVFHTGAGSIADAIETAGTEQLIHRPGYLPDQTLRHLHSGAVALVLPSACEGYGLPAIEAAACGSAVIVTTESPIPDLLAGGGLWVEPGDEDALYKAMMELVGDESTRRQLAGRARTRAAALTWDDAACRALDSLREVAAA